MNHRNPARVIAIGSLLVLLAAACGSDGDDEAADTTTTETTAEETTGVDTTATPETTAPATTAAPETTVAPETTAAETTAPATTPPTTAPVELEQRAIVALGEESLLADILALGVEPMASTATVDTVGFQGIPDYDTSNIEVLPVTTLSVEYVASLQPEMIIAYQYVVDAVGVEVLEGMAETIVLETGITSQEQITLLGEALGATERAAALVAGRDDTLTAGAETVADDCTVSVAAIYSGPSVAAFVDGPWEVPATVLELGCALDPNTSDAEPDGNGRAYLSLEQLTILDAPQMILMQNESVEGEQEAVDEIMADPIWQQLPAVQAGAVDVLDRLGYPGIEGEIRLVGDLTAILPTS